MKTILIILGIAFVIIAAASLLSDEPLPQHKSKRRRHRSSSSPKSLPWFDKNYVERKRRKKEDIFI